VAAFQFPPIGRHLVAECPTTTGIFLANEWQLQQSRISKQEIENCQLGFDPFHG
jgi:hypothetical protein